MRGRITRVVFCSSSALAVVLVLATTASLWFAVGIEENFVFECGTFLITTVPCDLPPEIWRVPAHMSWRERFVELLSPPQLTEYAFGERELLLPTWPLITVATIAVIMTRPKRQPSATGTPVMLRSGWRRPRGSRRSRRRGRAARASPVFSL